MADTDVAIPSPGAPIRVERTGPAIRAALAPRERSEFVAQFRIALAAADDTLDLTAVVDVIDRWWARAMLTANPEIEADALADQRRIDAGDPTVFGASASSPRIDSSPHIDPEDADGPVHDPLGDLRRATA
jgi:hypothetical protein